MTPEEEAKIRQIFREELARALGTDQTDVAKLAALPLAERKAFAKAQMMERKRRMKIDADLAKSRGPLFQEPEKK